MKHKHKWDFFGVYSSNYVPYWISNSSNTFYYIRRILSFVCICGNYKRVTMKDEKELINYERL
jgi:hypothetical protein